MLIKDIATGTPDFISLVTNAQSFVITTHIKPDGDALGAEIGLGRWLMSIGKSIRILNYSPTPDNYLYLHHNDLPIEVYSETVHRAIIDNSDVLVLLDANDPNRTKALQDYFSWHKSILCIDHHLDPAHFAHLMILETSATSTGEMVYRIIQAAQTALGGTISQFCAEALYVAIMTDTGSFRFPRTTSSTFRMCADLIDLGADPVSIYERTYNANKLSRLILIGKALASLRIEYEQIAFIVVTQEDLRDANGTDEDIDGFVQLPMQVSSVVISVFMLQLSTGWKLSIRSKGNISAARIAQHFTGNGHFNAAGARIFENYSIQELQNKILDIACKEIST